MLSALYAIARPSVRLSLCPSHGCIIEKRLKLGLLKFSPYGCPIPLVVRGTFHPKILRGSRAGASDKGGVGKISSFLSSTVNISKTVADIAKVTIND